MTAPEYPSPEEEHWKAPLETCEHLHVITAEQTVCDPRTVDLCSDCGKVLL